MVITSTILRFDENANRWTPLAKQDNVLYIELVREVNRIPYARIEVRDGDMAKQSFATSSGPDFALGEMLQIQFREEGISKSSFTAFEGVVVRHSLEATAKGSKLILELQDKMVELTRSRNSRVYKGQSDDKIFEEILKRSTNTLKKGSAENWERSDIIHPEMIQYHCTDWDFILSRADANGWFVIVEDGRLETMAIGKRKESAIQINFPLDSTYELELEAEACSQYDAVEVTHWNLNSKNLQETEHRDQASNIPKQGNFAAPQIAASLGSKHKYVQSLVHMESGESKAWADGTLARSRLAMLRGRLALMMPDKVHQIKVGSTLDIKGVGARFTGETVVTALRHSYGLHGWRTDIQFGIDPKPFSETAAHIAAPQASGLLPAVSGLQLGVVEQIKVAKGEPFLIDVKVPAFGKDQAIISARMASPYAGKDHGFFFLPEKGDEVLLGFVNDDPRQTVILGGMYSQGKNPLPKAFADNTTQNVTKGILTKQGISILFKDHKSGSNSLEIKDNNGNAIILDSNGIRIEGSKIDLV